MAKVTPTTGLFALQEWGKFGKPNGVGEFWAGWSELGDWEPRAGYYRRQWNGHVKCKSRMKFYFKIASGSEAETHRRDVFRDGVTAWHALTDSERLVYNNLKYPSAQSGFNRFMTKYLKSH